MTTSEQSKGTGSDTISTTAKVMCALRALETERKENVDDLPLLFSDPLAAILAGDAIMERMHAKARDVPFYHKAIRTFHIRTRFHDDAITEPIQQMQRNNEDDEDQQQKGVKQVVLLGAGLDTRAYRLEELDESVTLWEVDTPEIVDYKSKFLQDQTPKCKRCTIATDLATSDWVQLLQEDGFDPEIPTVWILEGLVYYIPEASIKVLMDHISSLSSPGSVFAADMMNKAGTEDKTQGWNSMWKFGCDDPVAFLQDYGWTKNASAEIPCDAAKKYPGYDKEGTLADPKQGESQLWYVRASR